MILVFNEANLLFVRVNDAELMSQHESPLISIWENQVSELILGKHNGSHSMGRMQQILLTFFTLRVVPFCLCKAFFLLLQ